MSALEKSGAARVSSRDGAQSADSTPGAYHEPITCLAQIVGTGPVPWPDEIKARVPNEAGLKLELATPRYSFDATGRRVLESKDEIRKRISSGSPDIADALALTFALPVASNGRRPVDLSDFQFQDLGIDELSGERHFAYLTLRRERPLLHDYDPYAFLR